ncbi:MAG TPA: sialidase family protein [Ktedonobacteraceae bacterium]|nr:sialidase family protein [Ktedonobacteraceae bacterium]
MSIQNLWPRTRKMKTFLYFPWRLFFIAGAMLIVCISGGAAALAHPVTFTPSNGLQFTTQMRIGFHSGDDWEPSIAADRYGHVYALYKHYDVQGGGTCPGCDLHLLVQRSDDEGKTWSAPRPIAPGPVKGGQYDPQIMVDPADGRTVWASFLENSKSRIAVVKSTDFGQTWSKLEIVSDNPPGLDKDELAVRGNTIVVAYDDNYNTWAAVSVDDGAHWSTREVFPTSRRFSISLSAGAAIDSLGNIFVSWDSFDAAHRQHGNGPATLWVSKSNDNGEHWTRTVIDVSAEAPLCHPCGYAYLSSQMALRIGSDDTIYLLWNGSIDQKSLEPQRIFFSRSTDHGKTYSPRVDISDAPQGVENCFPAIAVGQAPGDVRFAWMDTRTGKWNVFFRESTDGGLHLSSSVRISSYVPGYPYLTKAGFDLPYGDYQSMAVDSDNNTQMAFGEGPSYQGPGNQWVSHNVDR